MHVNLLNSCPWQQGHRCLRAYTQSCRLLLELAHSVEERHRCHILTISDPCERIPSGA